MISECLVVEFRVTGDECPLADAARSTGSTIDARPPLLRDDGYALLQFSAADPAVGEHLDGDDRIRYLHGSRTEGRHTYRCLAKERCIIHDLIDVGFLVESVHHDRGTERYVGAVVGQDVLEAVLGAAGEAVGVSLERLSTLGEAGDTPVETRWDLTPAQVAAFRAALEQGYFDTPRAVTASDVAAELGISKSAFLERLRRGQASLLRQLFQ